MWIDRLRGGDSELGGAAAEARHAWQLLALPPRVAWFQLRAYRLARRLRDGFSLASATRPADLMLLLELARGRRQVVELGTATGWTAVSFALADPHRSVTTYDPVDYPARARYLELVGESVRDRITLVAGPGVNGPRDPSPVDLLYIDSSHERQETLDELRAWKQVLASGALVVFDDYTHPGFPGIRQAIKELGLRGCQRGTMFVHEVGASEGHVVPGTPGRRSIG